MWKALLAGVAAGAILGGCSGAAPSPKDAQEFVAKAETDLSEASQYAARSAWVRANFITQDTEWLEAKATGEITEMASRLAVEAAKYNKVKVDDVTRRKLELLKRGITLPAPARPGAARELSALSTKLDSTYSTGKFDFNGEKIGLDRVEPLLAVSRDPAETKALWEGWHSISPVMKADYAKLVTMANEGSVELGFKDTGALWRSGYDMDPDAFAQETDRLWGQLEPFYKNLHCYVRARLNEKYGDAVQPRTGPIRADLTGNMWAQSWGNIYDLVAPKGEVGGYDLDRLLEAKQYDPVKMMRTGENFYSSLGFTPLPETFWQRSLIVKPADREVVCHASAWNIDDKDDIRVKMCTKVNAEDFYTVHHELGHNYYQRAYKDQPYILKGGANDGFHEAIGDFAGLSALTPTYLNQIGLLDRVPGDEQDLPFLMKMALDKIAFLPFGLLVDKWRWQVFSGEASPAQYNDAWWALRTKYQGITPPGPRPADAFDAGAKYHIPGNTPYMRYFLAHIYQFQFHRAACKQAGWTGPLHRCSIYGNKQVGQKFNAMMEQGASKPWPETLALFTGEKSTDASAVADYFKPLNVWLTDQNKGETCGW